MTRQLSFEVPTIRRNLLQAPGDVRPPIDAMWDVLLRQPGVVKRSSFEGISLSMSSKVNRSGSITPSDPDEDC
jgi:hypothetical protein